MPNRVECEGNRTDKEARWLKSRIDIKNKSCSPQIIGMLRYLFKALSFQSIPKPINNFYLLL